MAMIDKPPLRRPAVSRTSVAEPGVLRRSRGLLETRRATCGHADDDRRGARHFLRGKQCRTEACGIIGMGIDPDDERSQITVLLDGPVDPAAL